MDIDNEDFSGDDIPPFLRKPPRGSQELDEMMLVGINHRLAWLESRGLRPHQNVLDRRAALMARLDLTG